MPVNPTYPGIYIEELPSNDRTIIPAPTSVAVFIGYAHPFKTKSENWGKPVRIFSFTEFEREFGGHFASEDLASDLPKAVQQFFLNGGSDAYVVPVQPSFHEPSPGTGTKAFPADRGSVSNISLESIEVTTPNRQVAVSVENPRPSISGGSNDVADIVISFGAQAETFRGVKFAEVEARLASSILVRVTSTSGTTFSAGSVTLLPPGGIDPDAIPAGWTTFFAPDFQEVFAAEGPLDKLDVFNLMCVPGVADSSVLTDALAFCENKLAFLIVDPPINSSADGLGGLVKIAEDVMAGGAIPKGRNGALYFPFLRATDPVTQEIVDMAPSGFVAGIFARTDTNRGVWKAPAGLETIIRGANGVPERGQMTDMRAGVLNNNAVNAIRVFPAIGAVVFGARTLVSENPAFRQWRYVPVRRMALFIEQTLLRNLGWVVFEPNDEPLWAAIRGAVETFMLSQFRQGAFQGATPSQAFLVKCDATTTTQDDINRGIVNILVGFRPLKPAEFVIIKITQLAGQVQS